MKAVAFAWRRLMRQRARAVLGILGVAAVGALLFDMLLLSRGLALSMETLLEQTGFDIRVGIGSGLPGTGPDIPAAMQTASELEALTEVDAAVPVRFGDGEVSAADAAKPLFIYLVGADTSRRNAWTIVEGRDVNAGGGEVVINRTLADRLRKRPGENVALRACDASSSAVPAVTFRIAGISEFPFDATNRLTAAMTLRDFDRACGGSGTDVANQMLVAATEGIDPEDAEVAIERRRPDLQAFTNQQVVTRLQQSDLSYFRQISFVLVTVTVSFAALLITVLLTVSVNQRLGEIAALRALGFSGRRVVADVFAESALLVGIGGALAVPLGLALASGLDVILKSIPGIPLQLHFFVFQPRALAVHVALFLATAIIAATYPGWIVVRLPIAGTLRNEVVS